MVSQSVKVGDFTRGLYISEAREAGSGFIAEAVAVSSPSDFAYSEHPEYHESEFRGKNDKQ
jgi:hypothetical protein